MPRKNVKSKRRYESLSLDTELELNVFCESYPHGKARESMRRAWNDNRDRILGEWNSLRDHPGMRPAAWWVFDFKGTRKDGEKDWEVLARYNLLWLWEREMFNVDSLTLNRGGSRCQEN